MARTFGRWLLLGTAVLSALAPVRAALAADPAWVRAIQDGISSQDREISRTSIGAVVTTLENKNSRNPDDLVTLYLLARAYAKKGAVKDAVQAYGELIQKDPGIWTAWRDRGILSFRRARTDPATGKVVDAAQDAQAISDLQRAIALKPDYVQALQDLAEIHLRAVPPRPAAAIPLLKQALNADPGLDTPRLQLVQALSAGGSHQDALDTLAPLLGKQPHDPRVRMVQGAVLAAMGKIADAQRIFKQLALDNPASPDPLHEWLRVTRKAATFDRDETIWFLEQLRRLTPNAKEKAEITDGIAKLKSAVARPAAAPGAEPSAPPTSAQLAAALRGPDAKMRRDVLQYLASRSPGRPKVEGDLLRAMFERLDPNREPEPQNRLLVLTAFEDVTSSGEAPGRVLAALIRASLRDPDPAVRVRVPDILATLDNRAVIPALVPYAKQAEVADAAFLAVSARNAVYALAKAEPPFADATPGAQAKAFSDWWESPDRGALKRAILADVMASTDNAPERMLIRLVIDDDLAVSVAAYRALLQVVDTLPTSPPADVPPELRAAFQDKEAREAWLRTVPRFAEADLAGDRRKASLDALLDWRERSPR
jgi:tetratricopeptide (TPR) repeat protein